MLSVLPTAAWAFRDSVLRKWLFASDRRSKPLERLLTTDASNGHSTAVRALAALGSLEVASVKALLENMTSADFELAEESALALVKTGHASVAKEVATTRRLQGLIAKWSL